MSHTSLRLARICCRLSDSWRARAWTAIVDAGGDPETAQTLPSLSEACLALCAICGILAVLAVGCGSSWAVGFFMVSAASGLGAALFED